MTSWGTRHKLNRRVTDSFVESVLLGLVVGAVVLIIAGWLGLL